MLYAMNLPFEVSDTSMEYNELSFGSLLKNPFQKLSIDLSSSTLLESIDVLIQVKSNISPDKLVFSFIAFEYASLCLL